MQATVKTGIVAIALLGCSQSDFSSDIKQEDKRQGRSDNGDNQDSSENESLVHEPVMTGGTFLACTAQPTPSDLPQTTCALSDGNSSLRIPPEYDVSFTLVTTDSQNLEHSVTAVRERTLWTLELTQAVTDFVVQMHIDTGEEPISFETNVVVEAYQNVRTPLLTQALHLGDNAPGTDVTLTNPEACDATVSVVSAESSFTEYKIDLQVHSATADLTIVLEGLCGIEQAAYLSLDTKDDQELNRWTIRADQTLPQIQMTLERGSYQINLRPEGKSETDLDDFVLEHLQVQIQGSFLLTPL
jgi:hypothetical protein